MRDSASALREAKATPQIPHTLLFDLRRREEGGAGTDGLRKHSSVPQFAASQIAAPCIFHDDAVGWIDDDPTSIHENLRNHMFGIAVGSQKEQAAHSQIGTSRKIQEGIRCSAADIQQL